MRLCANDRETIIVLYERETYNTYIYIYIIITTHTHLSKVYNKRLYILE